MSMLKIGDPAPDFSVSAHDGTTVRLSDYRGRKVVLWFYPKADTPG
jgi:peroxiredoxin Q/BCP